MNTFVRIVSDGHIGHHARVLLVEKVKTDDGEDEVVTDVTTALRVRSIGIDLTVGEVNRARLECLAVTGEIDAELDSLAIRFVGRTRFGRLVWRLKKWWWNVRLPVADTTTIGQSARTNVPGRRERW